MLGHQFVATVVAKWAGHDQDADFMPVTKPKKLLSLDVTEATFKALAKQRGTFNGK